MKPWLKFCTFGAKACATSLCSFILWTIWLGLALLLTVQIYIASSHELEVPPFFLRRMEARLAESGLRMTFGKTSFDPGGRVLLEDVRFFLPACPEPVLTTHAVFVRLNPRALLVGSLEPVEVHVMDATASAPAQLTPSGRTEQLLSELETTLVTQGHELLVRQLSARLANLTLSVHGKLLLPAAGDKTSGALIGDFLARHFSTICRQTIALQQKLAQLEEPALHLDVAPSATGAPTVSVTALARRIIVDGPVAAEVDNIIATTRWPLNGTAPSAPLEISAAAIRLGNGAKIHGVSAHVIGEFRTDGIAFNLREALLTIDTLEHEGVDARAISARVTTLPLPRIAAEITTRLLDAPIALRTETDFDARSALVFFEGAISPRVLDIVSQRVGTNVRRFYDFESLDAEAGEARFGAGWKFEKLSARVRVPRMNSYGVIMEDGRATVELEPGRFYSPEAFARVGDYFAHGTYEHNLRTQEYRFLLEGRVRPLAISRWFGPWWPNFFRLLEFPVAPPEASVDVAGTWRQGRQSNVFVFAETPGVIFRGTELERIRTRLFIRPGFFDGLEVFATRHEGEARGHFTYRLSATNEWDTLDFDGESSLDLPLIAQLLGPEGAKSLAPFHVAAPPDVKVRGTLHGPSSGKTSDDILKIEARTSGEFLLYDFPVQDVSFSALLRGSDITVDRFNGTFAGGAASGNARVWGRGAGRRVGFNAALEEASLGQAATTLQTYLAVRKGLPPPPPDRFVQERASLHLNVAASAEGNYDNPLSFQGGGNAILKGPGIGQVPLLGLLSELLTFTSLRFTEARGNFKIDGPKLLFPKIELRGANSAIDAHGDFSLDRRELNFNAKVFPFQESGNVLKSVVGAVLTPLSNVLEVKLSGTFEKPHWAFVMGPLNLLRSITEGSTAAAIPPDIVKTPEPAKPAEPTEPTEATKSAEVAKPAEAAPTLVPPRPGQP